MPKNFADVPLHLSYITIGATHLLIHIHSRKIINHWMLIDLEELAAASGKSIDEVLEIITRRHGGNDAS